METKTKESQGRAAEGDGWAQVSCLASRALRDAGRRCAQSGRDAGSDVSSGAQTRPDLAAGKEGQRPGLDRAAPLSGLPSG